MSHQHGYDPYSSINRLGYGSYDAVTNASQATSAYHHLRPQGAWSLSVPPPPLPGPQNWTKPPPIPVSIHAIRPASSTPHFSSSASVHKGSVPPISVTDNGPLRSTNSGESYKTAKNEPPQNFKETDEYLKKSVAPSMLPSNATYVSASSTSSYVSDAAFDFVDDYNYTDFAASNEAKSRQRPSSDGKVKDQHSLQSSVPTMGSVKVDSNQVVPAFKDKKESAWKLLSSKQGELHKNSAPVTYSSGSLPYVATSALKSTASLRVQGADTCESTPAPSISGHTESLTTQASSNAGPQPTSSTNLEKSFDATEAVSGPLKERLKKICDDLESTSNKKQTSSSGVGEPGSSVVPPSTTPVTSVSMLSSIKPATSVAPSLDLSSLENIEALAAMLKQIGSQSSVGKSPASNSLAATGLQTLTTSSTVPVSSGPAASAQATSGPAPSASSQPFNTLETILNILHTHEKEQFQKTGREQHALRVKLVEEYMESRKRTEVQERQKQEIVDYLDKIKKVESQCTLLMKVPLRTRSFPVAETADWPDLTEMLSREYTDSQQRKLQNTIAAMSRRSETPPPEFDYYTTSRNPDTGDSELIIPHKSGGYATESITDELYNKLNRLIEDYERSESERRYSDLSREDLSQALSGVPADVLQRSWGAVEATTPTASRRGEPHPSPSADISELIAAIRKNVDKLGGNSAKGGASKKKDRPSSSTKSKSSRSEKMRTMAKPGSSRSSKDRRRDREKELSVKRSHSKSSRDKDSKKRTSEVRDSRKEVSRRSGQRSEASSSQKKAVSKPKRREHDAEVRVSEKRRKKESVPEKQRQRHDEEADFGDAFIDLVGPQSRETFANTDRGDYSVADYGYPDLNIDYPEENYEDYPAATVLYDGPDDVYDYRIKNEHRDYSAEPDYDIDYSPVKATDVIDEFKEESGETAEAPWLESEEIKVLVMNEALARSQWEKGEISRDEYKVSRDKRDSAMAEAESIYMLQQKALKELSKS